jgi:RNA polymerase sigma-70 factor (family 1)
MNIEGLENSQETIYNKLFEQYYAPFCLYARRFIEDDDICKDIVSDVFATLWDKKDELILKSDTTLAYIKVCVRNNCLNYLKHQNYEWDYEEYYTKNTPVYEETPDSVYTIEEMYKMLYHTLDKLPQNYRDVFTKSFFEGKSRSEIANELNISIKSVNRYKQKAMELLKNELKDSLTLLAFLFVLNK